jgi:hypothetical protein
VIATAAPDHSPAQAAGAVVGLVNEACCDMQGAGGLAPVTARSAATGGRIDQAIHRSARCSEVDRYAPRIHLRQRYAAICRPGLMIPMVETWLKIGLTAAAREARRLADAVASVNF